MDSWRVSTNTNNKKTTQDNTNNNINNKKYLNKVEVHASPQCLREIIVEPRFEVPWPSLDVT
jgi:hypothetical protein